MQFPDPLNNLINTTITYNSPNKNHKYMYIILGTDKYTHINLFLCIIYQYTLQIQLIFHHVLLKKYYNHYFL